MLWFLSSKFIRNDVRAMIERFAHSCPPPDKFTDKSATEIMVNKSLDALYVEISTYAREQRLGIFGRARLAKAFQDEMRQQQYSEELVSRLVNAVTVNALVGSDRR